ncbi:branched-chain amino acid ABC transporter permease LivH, partial [Pseudomonas aeruginosa]
ITAIGMSLNLQNYVQVAKEPRQRGIPTLLDGASMFHVGDGFGELTYTKVFSLIASLIGRAVLTDVMRYTYRGRLCRATQQYR